MKKATYILTFLVAGLLSAVTVPLILESVSTSPSREMNLGIGVGVILLGGCGFWLALHFKSSNS